MHTYVNRAFIGVIPRRCNIDRCPIRDIIVLITCKQITAKQRGEREIQSETEIEREGERARWREGGREGERERNRARNHDRER